MLNAFHSSQISIKATNDSKHNNETEGKTFKLHAEKKRPKHSFLNKFHFCKSAFRTSKMKPSTNNRYQILFKILHTISWQHQL